VQDDVASPYVPAEHDRTWIDKVTFPGGIPSVRAIEETLTSHKGLRIRRLPEGSTVRSTLLFGSDLRN